MKIYEFEVRLGARIVHVLDQIGYFLHHVLACELLVTLCCSSQLKSNMKR
jgi:hypothetical protein